MALALSLVSPLTIIASKCCYNRMEKQFPSFLLPIKIKKRPCFASFHIRRLENQKLRSSTIRCAGQSGLLRVIQTVWKVGKSGIEAGTNVVPAAVPRRIARISVTVVVLAVTLFVLKSFLSTLFFALAVMGLSYFAFLALNNNNEGPKGGGGTTSVEDSLEEARKIMEKYK